MNLPEPKYPLQITYINGRLKVQCLVRKILMVLTPEEWVRQHVLHYLIEELGYNLNFITVEKSILVNQRHKRFDIMVYNANHKPLLIVECKAQSIKIDQATLNQIGQYNIALDAPYLVVTNWDKWMVAQVDKEKGTFAFLQAVPFYKEIAN